MDRLKLAVVGCGAVAKVHHLPAIALSDQIELTTLVDTSLPRARQLAEVYHVPSVVDDYRGIVGAVEAAIVTLPNCLHAPVTLDLLQSGIHVLVEKPMALKTSECDAMIAAARGTETTLAVGMDYRFFHASQFVKHLLDQKWLGSITHVDLRQGVMLSWPMASDYLLRKETAGGGVLIDFGVHVLDLLLWWLGDYDHVEYYDDAVGGVEADCELHLTLQCGAVGVVELSRTRTLRNTCIIEGERGTLEVGIWDPNPLVRLRIAGQERDLTGKITLEHAREDMFRDIFRRELANFTDAIRDRREPFIPGREGRRAVGLIEACYRSRQLLKHPWVFPDMPTWQS